jgi:PQQ-like domain
MSDRSSRPVSTLIRLAAATAAATGLLLSPLSVSASWTRFHADEANTGFVDVVTTPAGKGSLSVPGLGTFAPGGGPVIAPDGTVYLGTEQGKLIALQADGRQIWSRELAQAFPGLNLNAVASPAVGADGSIYVIGVVTFRDHTGGQTVTRHISELHKFTPGGGFLWHARLPARELGGGGRAAAPPNIWASSGAEAVMVYAVYPLGVGRLFAFSTDGAILAETVVSRAPNSEGVFDFCDSALGFGCFHLPPGQPADPADRLPAHFGRPGAGPAVVQVAGGPPLVVLADQFNDVVGYSFSPTTGFIERSRARDRARLMRSSPMLLLSGHTAVGTAGVDSGDGAIVFAGPAASKLQPVTVKGMGQILATPTRLADDRFVVVELRSNGSAISVLKRVPVAVPPPVRILSRTVLPGQSIAAAAASRTHVFVSTAGAFHSFDAETMTEVSRFSWVGGGMAPPAIGPAGHIYAIASNILFIFPPPGGFGP